MKLGFFYALILRGTRDFIYFCTMIEATLKTIDENWKIETYSTNATFGFDIKIAENKAHKIKIVFTDGLSNHAQTVKAEFEAFEKIELYFCMPEYWNSTEETWPMKWLDRLAEIPQKNKTWFGPGDTIPAGNPPELLSDRFPAQHFMLCSPIFTKDIFENPIWTENNISFLGIIPIDQYELEYKLRNSATILLRRLEKKGYDDRVDMFREAVCRKRILGLF